MDDPKLQEIKTLLLPMFKDELICDNSKYNDINCILKNRNILNEISIYRGNKSYTINKNQKYSMSLLFLLIFSTLLDYFTGIKIKESNTKLTFCETLIMPAILVSALPVVPPSCHIAP